MNLTRTPQLPGRRGRPIRLADRGSMAVELVIWVPFLVAFMVLIVAFGKYADTRGQVQQVARDAVRAATLERYEVDAREVAENIADASAPSFASCEEAELWGADVDAPLVFAAGEIVTVELVCQVSLDDLGLISLPGSVSVAGVSSAPLDEFRRTG